MATSPVALLTDPKIWLTAFVVAEWAIRIVMLIVVPFRRTPDAAKGWLLLILFEPTVGLALYLVFGRRRMPEWRLKRNVAFGELARPVYARLAAHPNVFHPEQEANVAPAVRLAEKLGDMPILGGNTRRHSLRLRRHRREARRRHRRRALARPSSLLHHRRRCGRGSRVRGAEAGGRRAAWSAA